MSALIPFGASNAFVLAVDMREVAAHYGVRWRQLRGVTPGSSETLRLARDALFWKLVIQRRFSSARAAQILGVGVKAAREAVARHAHRIAEHRAHFRQQQEASDAA